MPLLLPAACRQKHKQELAGLRTELSKLQSESKTGQKGKEVAHKELEATKKKLADVETKLKAALADKQQAVQDKANLERQLKQHSSQTAMLQKNIEKKDAMESKRRESILVVSHQLPRPCWTASLAGLLLLGFFICVTHHSCHACNPACYAPSPSGL